MNARLASIRQRRDALIGRSDAQRRAVCAIVQRWYAPLHVLSYASTLLRSALTPPPLIVAATALLRRTRYARLVPLIRVGVIAWQWSHVWRYRNLAAARTGATG